VNLVGRGSGSDTVFHDLGNFDYPVLCPSASFSRDTHTEMVVRALRRLYVPSARVNERHDIVLDPTDADADAGGQAGESPYTYIRAVLQGIQ
jgi:lipoate---protein ligase